MTSNGQFTLLEQANSTFDSRLFSLSLASNPSKMVSQALSKLLGGPIVMLSGLLFV